MVIYKSLTTYRRSYKTAYDHLMFGGDGMMCCKTKDLATFVWCELVESIIDKTLTIDKERHEVSNGTNTLKVSYDNRVWAGMDVCWVYLYGMRKNISDAVFEPMRAEILYTVKESRSPREVKRAQLRQYNKRQCGC